ncbi:MAG: D-aminoacyl-tRNA deacylase [Candidatus Zixiibacteriota bacterium]
MIALVQKVSKAQVIVEGKAIGKIGEGLVIFAGIFSDDSMKDLEYCARKCAELRIFPDEAGYMNLSLEDVGGQMLVISNFTLCARVRKGRRPSFDKAMKPPKSEEMVDVFIGLLKDRGIDVQEGKFGAHMDVELTNDGPITIIVDSREKR